MPAHAIAEPRIAQELTVPEDLTSPRSKLVYLYLVAAGGGTVDDLHAALGERKIALHPILDALRARGVVERDGDSFRPAGA